VATLVPEVDAVGRAGEEDLHLYGAHHQHGVEMFGASRGHRPPAAMMAGPAASAAHGKAALGLGDVDVASPVGGHDLGDHHRQGHLQAPLSLSLHGTADAALLALHHHHQLAGGVPGQHQPGAWPQQQGAWHLRGSRFLRPTQQLLQEFCTLPVDTTSTAAASKLPTKPASGDGVGSSSSAAPSAQIQAMNASELQRLKAKLYAMLQEVFLLSDRSSLSTPHQVTITITHGTGPCLSLEI